ncbi:stalk domain-containing protein, partial [Paenibacillus sp. D9]|uniref:stalk domain-containing protein n=1 Tax=Paenibacillus sp. D9 TaxID=665792 RepID=UPI003FA5BDFB
MSTGSKLAAVVLTAVLGTASAGAVQAAASQPSTGKLQWTVNGQSSEIRTLVLNGQQLVSVSDAAKALGAEVEIMPEGAGIRITLGEHSVLVKAGSKPLNEDGTAFGQVVQSWKQANYVDGASYVQALGGSYSLLDGSGISIQTLQLLEGAETAQWAGDGRLIVSVSDESGRTDYLVDATTGAYSQLLSSSGASDLVVSPDGGKVAFSETDGTLRTVDLSTLRMAKIGTDTSIKSNLQWSADGKSIYFLQGDKTNVIAAADVATGAVSKVLDDKVEYKGDLSVTAGGP